MVETNADFVKIVIGGEVVMLSEKLKMYRTNKGLSQEKLAEMLGVSRQAVSKWEAGQTTPSSDNLIALAKLYDVSLDELVGAKTVTDDKRRNGPKYNPILRANLTRLAIMCQTIFLNAAIREYEFGSTRFGRIFWMLFIFVPLISSSIWMAFNLRYEKNEKQLKKNSRIELLYCIIQGLIAVTGYYTKWYFPTAVLLITVCLVYILKINPKYMNRQLVREK